MAQIREFTSTNASYFILDGVKHPKSYEAVDDSSLNDNRLKVIPIGRMGEQLLYSTHYKNVRVNGNSFTSLEQAISAINEVVFSKGGGSGDGGTTVTKTSDLTNDGEDGLNPFITAQDIPAPVDISGKLDKPLAPDNVPTKVILGDGTTKNLSEITTDISGKEDKSNKQNNLTPDGTGDKYPTVDAVNDGLGNKLNKPTTDGSWVVTKSGSTITYTDASTLGQNIANTNLTWGSDRTQNLNRKKLSFTGGRFSVPALELEITAENSVPNKIWTAGNYLWHTNNLGISYRVAYDNQVIKTISGNVTLDDSYHNCIVRITANCTITVPNTLRADFNCVFDVIGLLTAQFVAGGTATFSAPFGLFLRDNMMCTLYKETNVRFRINGGLTLT